MMEILNYIIENRLVLIPVLYILGEFIKRTEYVKDKLIPSILLFIGIIFSVLMGGDTVINNIIQGILVAGATVLGNQIIKQVGKED